MDTTQIDASAKTHPTAEWLYKRILKGNGTTVNSSPTARQRRISTERERWYATVRSTRYDSRCPRPIGLEGRCHCHRRQSLGANPRWRPRNTKCTQWCVGTGSMHAGQPHLPHSHEWT